MLKQLIHLMESSKIYSDSDSESYSYLQMDAHTSTEPATDTDEGEEMEVEPSVEVFLHPQQYTEQQYKLPFQVCQQSGMRDRMS